MKKKCYYIDGFMATSPSLSDFDGDFAYLPVINLSGDITISVNAKSLSVSVRYNGEYINRDDPRLTKDDLEYLNYQIPISIRETKREVALILAENPLAPLPTD